MIDFSTLLHASLPLSGNNFLLLGGAFLAGILVSFTPCVYPMIPITAGILQQHARKSLFYNILSSLIYIIGVAIVYATLGYLSATTSLLFGKWLANPWFLLIMVSFFLYLSFNMFGFYELYLPGFLKINHEIAIKGSLLRVFLFGIAAGTIASPCMTPALAALLIVAAKQSNPFMGFALLFSFSIGMGMLLLLIGTFSSIFTMLPKANTWMDTIKKILGFCLLGTCVYLLQPILPLIIALLLYSIIFCMSTWYFLKIHEKTILAIAIGIVSLILSGVFITYTIKALKPSLSMQTSLKNINR